jgi:hypothetical protein
MYIKKEKAIRIIEGHNGEDHSQDMSVVANIIMYRHHTE